jgi:hypothetical protein
MLAPRTLAGPSSGLRTFADRRRHTAVGFAGKPALFGSRCRSSLPRVGEPAAPHARSNHQQRTALKVCGLGCTILAKRSLEACEPRARRAWRAARRRLGTAPCLTLHPRPGSRPGIARRCCRTRLAAGGNHRLADPVVHPKRCGEHKRGGGVRTANRGEIRRSHAPHPRLARCGFL